jgi:hypothetical protein
LVVSLLLGFSQSHAQEKSATNSGEVNELEITQNIKDRIKKIATQSSSLTQKRKIAFIGSIEKIANETITIKTQDDINLASVSATTTYVRMPGGSESKLSDVSIGDFAVAMGFINGSEVLQTKRILLYDKAPESPKKTSVAGLVKLVDNVEQAITLIADRQDFTISFTKKTLFNLQRGLEKETLKAEQLEDGQLVTIIYVPAVDEYSTHKALSVLATTTILELPTTTEIASPSGKPTVPPELGI